MKWLIIFPNDWLAYSPSCLNFAKMLQKNEQEYLIICPNDSAYDNSDLLNIKREAVFFNPFIMKILNIKRLRRLVKFYKIYCFYKQIKSIQKYNKFDKIIGVDEIGFLASYFSNKKAIYYSLEVSNSFLNRFIFGYLKPSFLIIQSKERKDYLKHKGSTVYIQNSPILKKRAVQKEYGGKLLYFGNLLPCYGLDGLFDSLYSINETLYIKHLKSKNAEYMNYIFNKYKDLINKKRIIFDEAYIEQDSVIDYIYDFDIGFCFFDMQIIEKDFNCASSPSGKMFNYFAAGAPVIANDVVGFKPTKDFNAGILLENVNSQSIIEAIGKIRDNYNFFRENSINAGVEFDYARMFDNNKEKFFSIL